MNSRERFLATLAGEPLDRPLYWECAFWPETLQRWYREGLPQSDSEAGPHDVPGERRRVPWDVERHFGFDPHYLSMPVETRNLCPGFQREIIEKGDAWILQRNRNGALEKVPCNGTGMRAMVKGVVQNRDDWERIKAEHLRPVLDGRVPDCFDQFVSGCSNATRPIWGLHCEHWLNLAEYLSIEELLCLVIEDPEWLKQMFADMTAFFLGIADQVLERVVPDMCWVGGDFCYKSGPMMSPDAFRAFLLPEFRKVSDYFRGKGVRGIFMHTDGDCRSLIPLFQEAGVDGAHPFEVTNGQDIVKVREAFPDFMILGGIDKKAIAAGRTSIDRELESKLPYMLRHGRYIPYIDHAVPPSVSLDDFTYYRQRINEIVMRERNRAPALV